METKPVMTQFLRIIKRMRKQWKPGPFSSPFGPGNEASSLQAYRGQSGDSFTATFTYT